MPPSVMLASAATLPAADKKFPWPGWWVSTKLDGVRAVWDGAELKTRTGHTIPAPEWFVRGLPPDLTLDGELYGGPHTFATVNGAIRRSPPRDEDWKKIHYSVFDLIPGEKQREGLTFQERYRILQQVVSVVRKRGNRSLELVRQQRIRAAQDLYRLYDRLIARGEEGVILKDPDSSYEFRRSRHMVKLKPTPDAEAVVVGFKAGRGQHRGRLGAFEVAMLDPETGEPGHRFFLSGRLPASVRDQYRFDDRGRLVNTPPKHCPRLGSVVTYEFMNVTDRGLPRQPVFLRMRDR